jgi:membrane protease YdiL (CAAX protease family)
VKKPTPLALEVTLACVVGVIITGLAGLLLGSARPVYPSFAQGLWLVIATPVVEELAFRGFLQTELRQRLPWAMGRISLANVLTSGVFMLLHWMQHQTLLAAAVFMPSLIFGYFKDRFNTVKPSIFLHVFYNAAYFLTFGIG